MSAKSQISSITTELERMPEHVEDARKALEGWRSNTVQFVKKNPGRSVVSAFAIGYVLAKVGRYI